MNTQALLFKWPHRHRIYLLLPTMLVLAALAHGGIFFLFSVANPPVKADGLHTARVYFLNENNPALAQLETTLTSNDPALFAPRHGISASRESIAVYNPQYASARTALLNMPPRKKTDDSPSPVAAPVAIAPRPSQRAIASTRQDSNRLTASPELAARLPEPPHEILHPQNTDTETLDSASFFIGIRSDGTVAHILPAQSSGNADLDLQAMRIMKTLRFASAENTPLAWGVVNLHFGAVLAPTTVP
jgi:hypothetical protein